MESLLNLLRLSNQDIAGPCRIITAVTVQAASAAADLLASGDYAVAFPQSTILHHGVRQSTGTPSTLESTGRLNEQLRISNSIYAMQLAKKSEDRFTFRFYTVMDEFASIRETRGDPNLSNYDCFIQVIEGKLSSEAKQTFHKAVTRAERYKALINSVVSGTGFTEAETLLKVQAIIIKAIVEFEVSDANSADTPQDFRLGGMRRLVDDFYLLNEYLSGNSNQKLEEWCKTIGRLFLTSEQQAEVDGIEDEGERTKRLVDINKPILQPMLSFFIALCHALQEGENELTATDAYWLGLVDEVVGDDLWNLRLLYEFEADPEEEAGEDGKTSESPQEDPSTARA